MSFKEFLKSKDVSEKDFENMSAEETAKLQGEYNDARNKEVADAKEEIKQLKERVEKASTKEDVSKIQKELSDAIKKYDDIIETQGEEITEMKEKLHFQKEKMSFKDNVKSALIEKKDLLAKMKDDPSARGTLTVKAPVAMTFATNTTGNVGRMERESGIESAARREPVMLQLVNTRPTNASIYSWVEKTGHEGGVEMVPEGGLKPQGDWDLVEYTQKPQKDALIVTVSKEMIDDIDGMAQDIVDEIYEQIELFSDAAVLEGDGTGNNIVGLDANATPFVAGSFADTITRANNMDVLRVAVNQVELSNDRPSGVLMHPSDAAAMELEKLTDGAYVLPPFVTAEGTRVKGLPVTTSTLVTQGEAYVGNFKRFQARIRENITLEMGYRGQAGDWERNFISFLGEQRFFGFIKAVHYTSIVKVDFTTAKALLDPAV